MENLVDQNKDSFGEFAPGMHAIYLHKRHGQIKMLFSYLHFKTLNILPTFDEPLRSNFFLESITPNTSEMKKNLTAKVLKYVKCYGV